MEHLKLSAHFNLVKKSSLFKGFYDEKLKREEVQPMEKHILRNVLEKNFNVKNEKKGVYLVRSGGSSAKPLVFPVDIKENLHQRNELAKELVKDKIFTSETIALNLFSYKNMYRSAGILDDILERCEATTLSLSAASDYDIIYNSAIEFGANLAMGTPTKLVRLANYVLENNLEFPLDKVLYAGEFLMPSHAKLFQKVFGVKQILSLYGSAETGIWGWGNYTEPDMHFRVLDDLIIEIEDSDCDGNGKVIVTNLLRKRFPIYRYFMGDIGRVVYKNEQRFLLLKSREPKSFSIHSEAYFLNDFDWLYNYVDRFQIQLNIPSTLQTEVKFLLVNCNNSEEDIQIIKEKMNAIFKFDSKFVTVIIEFVKQDQLYVNETSSKTPIIVDLRM